MSGQSTGMQMESLVDALLSDERVLTAGERALLANILQIVTSPSGSPQIDAQVAGRVMAAIGTSVFQRALGVLSQAFAQRLIAPSIPPPQTNVGPTTPAASSQTSPTGAAVDPLRLSLPPFVIPFFPLPPFIFNPPTPATSPQSSLPWIHPFRQSTCRESSFLLLSSILNPRHLRLLCRPILPLLNFPPAARSYRSSKFRTA